MGQFAKYMVFGTQLYEIWKPAFNVESYILFHALWADCIFCVEIRPLGIWVSSILSPCQHGPKPNSWKTQKNQYLTIWTRSYQFSQNFMLSFCPNPTVFPANHILNNTTHLGPFIHCSLLLSEIIPFFL